MSLDVGSRLGAYEVLALIGEGGMGRVFRARDTRLKRDVAIKALHPSVAGNADRVARFRREAEALAALNHPHIASIHDVLDEAGSQFLVLEMIEGQTLAERIEREAIPSAEALAIALQIASALEAAHERGIVHRDLKPANVKITPAGVAKVLDFGLAKDWTSVDAQHASLTHSPTMIASGTAGGLVLGTASYMSPEQARGQMVDAQSDIWAFGCVLFEMLARQRAFGGPTVTDVLAAVVRGEVEWSQLPESLPLDVTRLIRRCLHKERRHRLHHIADARIALEDALTDSSSKQKPAHALHPETSRRAWIAAAVLFVIAAGLAAALAFALRPAAVAPEVRVEINTPPSLEPAAIAISPDGRALAFIAAADGVSRLWVRQLSSSSAQPLPGTELATSPFWSPDSRSLAFFADGKLKRIDVAGGVPRVLADAPIGTGGSWSRDGVIVFAPSAIAPLFQVSASGGGARTQVTQLQRGQTGHRYPQFLPDERHFIFYARGTPEVRGIFLGSLDGAPLRRVTEADSNAVITSNNQLLFVRQPLLLSQAFDTNRLEVSGEVTPIADQVAFVASTNLGAVTASRAGPIAYRASGPTGQGQLVWFDRSGKRQGTIGSPDAASLLNPEMSPDGRWVVHNRTVDAYQDIWLVEAARGVLRRFTFDPNSDQIPVWTPDGQRIAFSSNRVSGTYDLYVRAATGNEPETVLLSSDQNKFAMNFSPDGRFLLYRVTEPNTNWDLWALPIEQGMRPGKPFPVVQSPFQELMGEISPDGRWVAFQSNESGRYETYVQSFPQAGPRMQVSINGGSQPRWRGDGHELFYMALDARLLAAPTEADAKGQLQVGKPVELFVVGTPGGPVPIPQKHQYWVSRDGQRVLVNTLTAEATASPITLILNWAPPQPR